MKIKSCIFTVVFFSFFPIHEKALAQQAEGAKSMEFLVGEWKYQNLDGGTNCKWFGDSAIKCEGAWTNQEGNKVEALWLTKFDAESKSFTGYRFYSGGYSDSGPGWVNGNKWTFVYEGKDGARYKFEGILSGDTWSYEWYTSEKGAPWKKDSDGSMTKVN